MISEKEIAADFGFWFSMLEQIPDLDANELGIEARRAAKLSEVSAACEEKIVSGIDVKIGEATPALKNANTTMTAIHASSILPKKWGLS